MKVDFFKHNIDIQEKKRIEQVLNSFFITTGKVVREFEEKFASYLGVSSAVTVSSGTAALHLSLLAAGINRDDEVITTPLSFMGTANAILHANALPVFIDVEPETGNMNAALIENAITKKTRAILPVHLYGNLCDMKKIYTIAKKYQLKIIEDAAHSIEGERDGIKPGFLGDFACFSFYATKSITCGEGGAIATNHEGSEETLKLLRLHGMNRDAESRYWGKYRHYDMEILGWKYNLSDIQAALLIGQLEKIEEYRLLRKKVYEHYAKSFKCFPDLQLIQIPENVEGSYHLFTIRVDPDYRDIYIKKLQGKNIGVSVHFLPIHLLKYYRTKFSYKKGMFPVAEKIGSSTITLPLHSKLTESEVEYVVESFLEIHKKLKKKKLHYENTKA